MVIVTVIKSQVVINYVKIAYEVLPIGYLIDNDLQMMVDSHIPMMTL